MIEQTEMDKKRGMKWREEKVIQNLEEGVYLEKTITRKLRRTWDDHIKARVSM
jgi:hypothetical protein